MLADPWGASGLALATAIGAWINFGLLVALAMARDWMSPDAELGRFMAAIATAAGVMALTIHGIGAPIHQISQTVQAGQNETELAILALSGLSAYLLPLYLFIRLFNLSLKQKQ